MQQQQQPRVLHMVPPLKTLCACCVALGGHRHRRPFLSLRNSNEIVFVRCCRRRRCRRVLDDVRVRPVAKRDRDRTHKTL